MGETRLFALLPAALAACAHLAGAPGFAYRDISVKCLRDLPEGGDARVSEAARDAIDVLLSDEFKDRAERMLSSPDVRHGRIETAERRGMRPRDMVRAVEEAGASGFSIDTKSTMSSATNAWDGYDDQECGRIVLLSRSKVLTRPAYLWAGTIVHELSHVAGFFHDGQKREGNECMIPNLLGDLAEWSAWEKTHPNGEPFVTWETVCTAFAAVCTSDPHGGCTIGTGGTTRPPS
jgi:hypothetical protein